MRFLVTTSVAAMTCALCTAASAATLSEADVTIATSYVENGAPSIASDSDIVTNGDAQAFEPGIREFAGALAIQNADGTSEVRAVAGGQAPFEKTTATATFTQSVTNTTGAAQSYTLGYELGDLSAELSHGFGLLGPIDDVNVDNDVNTVSAFGASGSTTGTTGSSLPDVNPFVDGDPTVLTYSQYTAASFEYYIDVDSTRLFSARADALVNDDGGTLVNVENFDATLVGTSGFVNIYDFSVEGISGTFNLTAAAGETLTVKSGLIARAYAQNSEGINSELELPFGVNGVNSFLSDPVTLSSASVSLTANGPATPNVVPLPAAGWLLLASLGGLAAAGRRRTM